MRFNLGTKAFVAFAASTLAILALTAMAVHWSFQRGLMDYVNDLREGRVQILVERLASHYAQEGNWEFLRNDQSLLRTLMSRRGRVQQPDDGRERVRRWRRHQESTLTPLAGDPVGTTLGIAVVDAAGKRVVGPRRPNGDHFDIVVGEKVVGQVIVPPLRSLSDAVDLDFAARQGRWLVAIFAAGLGIAALVAWFFSRQLTAPVRALTDGTRALAAGRYGDTIDVRQRDELGRLARDFNALSQALARNREARRALLADVSHELRTPLAALRGQVSALRDGVRQPTAERLTALDAQVTRLVGLVDELYDLSLADSGSLSYEKSTIDVRTLLEEAHSLFVDRLEISGIALALDLPEDPVLVHGDRRRLLQMISNLLENTARYTDRGGRARLALHTDGDAVSIALDDSAPAVPASDLPHLFERLYRVEKSRSRARGGAGLGLALVARIAQAHGGDVTASASELGGLCITIVLSAYDE